MREEEGTERGREEGGGREGGRKNRERRGGRQRGRENLRAHAMAQQIKTLAAKSDELI